MAATRKKATKKKPIKKKAQAKKKTGKRLPIRKRKAKTGPKPGKGSKGGRPKIIIDQGLVEQMALIHCTDEEIAAVCGCSVDTLTNRFSDLLKNGREMGRSSLRRMQYDKAKEGNPALLIWLGKQMLGQKDIVVQEQNRRITEIRRTIVRPDNGDAED